MKEIIIMKEIIEFPDKFPLHMASLYEDISAVKKLLRKGYDINQRDNTPIKGTPLLISIIKKNYELAEFLIKNGSDINLADATDRNLLIGIIMGDIGNIDIARLLLKNGANVNCTYLGATALQFACFEKKIGFIDLLIEFNADLDLFASLENYGIAAAYPPLMISCLENDLAAVKTLVKAGVDVNKRIKENVTVLYLLKSQALFDANSNIKIIEFLESHGAKE